MLNLETISNHEKANNLIIGNTYYIIDRTVFNTSAEEYDESQKLKPKTYKYVGKIGCDDMLLLFDIVNNVSKVVLKESFQIVDVVSNKVLVLNEAEFEAWKRSLLWLKIANYSKLKKEK